MAAAVDEYVMSIVNEEDAFIPMNLDAGEISNTEDAPVLLLDIPLNTDLGNDAIRLEPQDIQGIDSIHCKAFGVKTGIQYDETNGIYVYPGGTNPIINDFDIPMGQYLCLLAQQNEENRLNIILISIVAFHQQSTSGIVCADIWSVAKNPEFNVKGAFGLFLQKLREEIKANHPQVQITTLQVGTDNTMRMTEQGRLRLYSSLGFTIVPGCQVETIYPPSLYTVVNHDVENSLIEFRDGDCAYIGNIKSHTAITMAASIDDIGEQRNIYGNFKGVFTGEQVYLYDDAAKLDLYDAPGFITDNAKVKPVTKQEDGSSLFESEMTLHFYKAFYHAGIQKKPFSINENSIIKNNNIVECIDVPDNVIIFTTTSPGSYMASLYVPNETDELVKKIIGKIYDPTNIDASMGKLKELYNSHRSKAKLPIYNIERHDRLLQIYNEGSCEQQFNSSLLNSIIIDSLGHQPIFEAELDEPISTGKHTVRKQQYDLQMYTPGMKIYNYGMARESNIDKPNGRKPSTYEKARNDDAMGLGTFKIHYVQGEGNQLLGAGGSGAVHTNLVFKKFDDDSAFVNNKPDDFNNLKNYLTYFKSKTINTTNKDDIHFIFLFGCAGIETKDDYYELLYELSHRRSIVYRFPPKTTSYNDIFIEKAVFGKNLLTEHVCEEIVHMVPFTEVYSIESQPSYVVPSYRVYKTETQEPQNIFIVLRDDISPIDQGGGVGASEDIQYIYEVNEEEAAALVAAQAATQTSTQTSTQLIPFYEGVSIESKPRYVIPSHRLHITQTGEAQNTYIILEGTLRKAPTPDGNAYYVYEANQEATQGGKRTKYKQTRRKRKQKQKQIPKHKKRTLRKKHYPKLSRTHG